VATLLEGEHAVGVVGEFPDEQNAQGVLRRWRVGALPVAAVLLDLVDPVADGRVHPNRLAHMEPGAVCVQPPFRLAQELVQLPGVVDPLARDDPGLDASAALDEPAPEHAVQVVRHQLRPLEPTVAGAAVQHLHELEGFSLDSAEGVAVVMVPHPVTASAADSSASRAATSVARCSGVRRSSCGR
jgi:hypothetical protein